MGVYIIAEAGVNHNGDINLAKRMIEVAKSAGANAVKFQTFQSEKLVSQYAKKAKYQVSEINQNETQLEMLKKLELSYKEFVELARYSQEVGIEFLSTPFDFESIDFLAELGIKLFKIPSGEITNIPYLVKIAKFNKPIILSTGMSTMEDVHRAIQVLTKYGSADITLLHCNTEYPTPFEDVNLKAMETLRQEFKLPIGYSDHTIGNEVSIAAVALGAQVIEKHFTLDKYMEGPDHKASMEPKELISFVQGIRNIEKAMGSKEKKPSPSEWKNMTIARKSIVASRNIKKGEVFSEDNITVKRPGNGVSPIYWFEVIGTEASKDFERDELIEI